MILPALTEAKSPYFRPIKYSLFPPLGLATLAGYLDPDDDVTISDEHVESLAADDAPDLVVIQVYITSSATHGLPRRCSMAMRGMGRLWQAAGTVKAVLEQPGLLERAVDSGLRSLFVGFETVNAANLSEQHKYQNIGRNYDAAIERLHELGVMVNGSFVFGMDGDDADVFDRTVDWAINVGIETATFHILTPYPDTALYQRMEADGRLLHHDWDRYDTRHVVFKPANMTPETLVRGYWRAYRDFYRWGSILRGAATKTGARERMRHVAYAGGWKKFEPMWNVVIRSRQVLHALPVLELILSGFGTHRAPRLRGSLPRVGRPLELPAGFHAGVDGHLVGADLHRLSIADRSAGYGPSERVPSTRL